MKSFLSVVLGVVLGTLMLFYAPKAVQSPVNQILFAGRFIIVFIVTQRILRLNWLTAYLTWMVTLFGGALVKYGLSQGWHHQPVLYLVVAFILIWLILARVNPNLAGAWMGAGESTSDMFSQAGQSSAHVQQMSGPEFQLQQEERQKALRAFDETFNTEEAKARLAEMSPEERKAIELAAHEWWSRFKSAR